MTTTEKGVKISLSAHVPTATEREMIFPAESLFKTKINYLKIKKNKNTINFYKFF